MEGDSRSKGRSGSSHANTGLESFSDWFGGGNDASGSQERSEHRTRPGRFASQDQDKKKDAAVRAWLDAPGSALEGGLTESGERPSVSGARDSVTVGATSEEASHRRSSAARLSLATSAGEGSELSVWLERLLPETSSVRTSLAIDRASFECNRSILEMMSLYEDRRGSRAPLLQEGAREHAPRLEAQGGSPTRSLLGAWGIAEGGELARAVLAMGILPPQTPLNLDSLAMLWALQDHRAARPLAEELVAKGVLASVTTADGSLWAIPQPSCLSMLVKALGPERLRAMHRAFLLRAGVAVDYGAEAAGRRGGRADARASAGGKGDPKASPGHKTDPKASPGRKTDHRAARLPARAPFPAPGDAYMWMNVGHHLLGAGAPRHLQAALLDPDWLEQKLRWTNPVSLVADFRRVLRREEAGRREDGADREAEAQRVLLKLVLQALLLSRHALRARGAGVAGLLRVQLLGRLMAATPASPDGKLALDAWWAANLLLLQRQNLARLAGGVQCLPALTAAMEQAGGLHRLTLHGHTGAVTQLCLQRAGGGAVSGSSDGTARVWDLEVGDCTLVLTGHTGAVTGLVLSQDGSLAVTGSLDGTIRAFELASGRCLRTLCGPGSDAEAPPAAINALDMDQEGQVVVAASASGLLEAWDLVAGVRAGAARVCAEGVAGGALCVTLHRGLALAGAADGTVAGVDAASGAVRWQQRGHDGWVAGIAASGAQGASIAVSAGRDGVACVWNATQGARLRTLTGDGGCLTGVKLSASGRIAVTYGEDSVATAWDVKTGARGVAFGVARPGWVSSVAISAAAPVVVTGRGDGSGAVYDSLSGAMRAAMERHVGAVLAIDLSSHGRFACTGGEDGTVRLWDLGSGATDVTGPAPVDAALAPPLGIPGRRVVDLRRPEGAVDGRDFIGPADSLSSYAPGKCLAVSVEELGPVRVWSSGASSHWAAGRLDQREVSVSDGGAEGVSKHDAATHDAATRVADGAGIDSPRQFSTHAAAAPSPGHPRAPFPRQGWPMRCRQLATQKVHAAGVRWAFLSADGGRALTASADRAMALWDVATGRLLCARAAQQGSRLKSVAVSASLDTIFTCLFDSTLELWRAPLEGVAAKALGAGGAAPVDQRASQADPDAAPETASPVPAIAHLHTLQRWDYSSRTAAAFVAAHGAEAGAAAGLPSLDCHTAGVNCVLLTADGVLGLSLGKDWRVRVWDVAAGRSVSVLVGHTDAIAGGALVPACEPGLGPRLVQRLVTWSLDRTLRVWDLLSGRQLAGWSLGPQRPRRVAVGAAAAAVCLADGAVLSMPLNVAGGAAAVLVAPPAGSADDIVGAAISPDGTRVALATKSGQVAVRSLVTGALCGLFESLETPTACCWASNSIVAAGCELGAVHLLAVL